MSQNVTEGAMCRPNFSAAGRRRRTRVAIAGAVLALVTLAGLVAIDASWPWRFFVALPAGLAFVSGFQVRRNTCVAHAATGTFENDDFSRKRVDDEFAAASRRVAATILRDAAVGSTVVGALSAATAFVG